MLRADRLGVFEAGRAAHRRVQHLLVGLRVGVPVDVAAIGEARRFLLLERSPDARGEPLIDRTALVHRECAAGSHRLFVDPVRIYHAAFGLALDDLDRRVVEHDDVVSAGSSGTRSFIKVTNAGDSCFAEDVRRIDLARL